MAQYTDKWVILPSHHKLMYIVYVCDSELGGVFIDALQEVPVNYYMIK